MDNIGDMNKIYLHQYFSIVLSLVFLFLLANNANLLYILYNFSLTQPAIGEDVSFRIKFYETIFLALTYLAASVYMAVTAVLNLPLVEYGKSSKKDEKDSE